MKNGEKPSSIAVIHCVGSRDTNHHVYCSRVCCMYALKYGHLIKEKLGHDTKVHNFYIDMRCYGKGYEEFYRRLQEEGINFVRGKPAEILEEVSASGEKKLIVVSEDTLLGKCMRIPVDMAVLCTAVEARKNAPEVARIFGISQGGRRFLSGGASQAGAGLHRYGRYFSGWDLPESQRHFRTPSRMHRARRPRRSLFRRGAKWKSLRLLPALTLIYALVVRLASNSAPIRQSNSMSAGAFPRSMRRFARDAAAVPSLVPVAQPR